MKGRETLLWIIDGPGGLLYCTKKSGGIDEANGKQLPKQNNNTQGRRLL